MAEATTTDPGCGCCRPDPKSTPDLIRELQARRDQLDERLRRLEDQASASREPVGVR